VLARSATIPVVAYDDELAARVRSVVAGEPGLTQKRMFGGLAFLVDGNLAVSVSSKGGLLVRVDPAETESLVETPFVEPFEMRGRAMSGWLHVTSEAVETDGPLERWVRRGVTYARSLGPK
jgi:TfoX/Sxy family transcriptional regulator of competence genes